MPISGVCRICGCTETTPCYVIHNGDDAESFPCSWVDVAETLCSNPRCVAEVPMDELLVMEMEFLS